MRKYLAMLVVVAQLGACVSAPRGPAGALADAGTKATGAMSGDVRLLSHQLQYLDVTNSFSATWDRCQNPAICAEVEPSDANGQQRQALSNAILLRAKALDSLGHAYAALKLESDYDGRADLGGAVGEAITNVNAFASAVYAAGAGAPAPALALISQPLGQVASFGAGLVAERRQRDRIIHASAVIRVATTRLRDALRVESYVYESLATYVAGDRTRARLALLDAGLISSAGLITPMATDLDVKLVAGADGSIDKSPAAQQAVRATVAALSRADVEAVKARYRASIDALGALIGGHVDLEARRPVSIDDVARFLTELDTAVASQAKK